MEIITKYRSDDGIEFVDMQKCLDYEDLCHRVDVIMACLLRVPAQDSCDFANGSGYIQHSAEAVTNARRKIIQCANEIMPHKWFQQELAGEDVHASWGGRLIGEMQEKCLWTAWYRFSCMDANFREYGQPYYALNPEHCKNICLAKA